LEGWEEEGEETAGRQRRTPGTATAVCGMFWSIGWIESIGGALADCALVDDDEDAAAGDALLCPKKKKG
jgi:hypothetical protein